MYSHKPLVLVLAYAFSSVAWAQGVEEPDVQQLQDLVVMVAPTHEPNTVCLNPKSAFQPMPATDGAGLLKAIPNMGIIRKGGMSGEPLFRGLGGSRLGIYSNDSQFFGGCPGRMDPPTAYIFPQTYDEVILTKGPQTVVAGPGQIAGSVQFNRKPYYFDEPGIEADGSLTVGSFNRFDGYGAVTAGMPWGYIHANATRNTARDYKDGDGNGVHSAYQRHSQQFALGITPDPDSVIEFGYQHSRGWAAYGDRGMDGSIFDRDAFSLRAEKRNISSWLSELSFNYGYSYVDHVMDNYRHRTHTAPMFMAMNPDRRTQTARLKATLELANTTTELGLDFMWDRHRGRMGRGMNRAMAERYKQADRKENQKFNQWGLFAETTWRLNDVQRLVGGLRYDRITGRYFGEMGKGVALKHSHPDLMKKTYHMGAGFLRYEHDINNFTFYAGYGIAQRAPDFWERDKLNGWFIKPETNHEIDLGLIYRSHKVEASLTVFASQLENFILIDADKARNIRARRYGFEGDINYEFVANWHIGTSIAYTHGQNRSDKHALAQTPPLEANSYIGYDNGSVSANFLMRNVARQNRYAKGQGNIVGTDNGPSSGFTVFSANVSYQLTKNFSLSGGVDNIFNRTYREFINRSSADIADYNPIVGQQINEPGRQFWLRLQGTY
ncbi:TonB-dependent copper receptor [Oligella urethralis]|uniref:TonB-dependent copper receptor n=1 Tax=Oligella urethralis TaxID=90245 RepID=UPI000D0089CB|nr:TonB-dependent copper receptor [Oligella urethralis]AVL70321.1 TonB-dependent copper receptor [Oligella urethralis]